MRHAADTDELLKIFRYKLRAIDRAFDIAAGGEALKVVVTTRSA
jgi:hypothetical protein